MINQLVQLAFMLLIILLSAELFTNGLEHAGEKLGISEGVVGSIFAAVATALPETTIPVLAIVAGTSNQHANEEISVGAILGAPLMLVTLSTMLMAASVLKKRGLFGKLKPEITGFSRDIQYFLVAFIIAAIAMFVPIHLLFVRIILSIVLIGLYAVYLYFTFKASKNLVSDGHGVTPHKPVMLSRIGLKDSTTTICMQLILGLALLLIGAKGFIRNIEQISLALDISPLLLSILIVPIATELPEKINSVMWVRRHKDTLAFGNITGAMVFQGTLLPALGILLTPWQPSREVATGMIIAFLAALWLKLNTTKKGISLIVLLANGGFYILYLYLVLG